MSITDPVPAARDRVPGSGTPALVPRAILSAAWPLFKACLPVCLPMAVIGVAAGATPGSEAAMSGERSLAYTRDWWGLVFASTVLTLICYGGVLRHQFALAAGERPHALDSLRQAALDVPFVAVLLVLLALPLAPAMLVTVAQGFGPAAAVLTLAACVLLLHGWFAWPAMVAADRQVAASATRAGLPALRARAPWPALARSVQLVRRNWRQVAMLGGTLLAAVLVFVLLTGIFMGVVMGLAGQANPSAGGLALSRWLMALVLALPVVYGGAVTVTAWRALETRSPD